MLILRNVTGVLQDVAGLQFDPNEERDIHADLQPTDIQDAWVNPLNKKLSDAMDDGDFIRVALAPYLAPGSIGNAVIPATVAELEAVSSAVSFRGEVANPGLLSGITTPVEFDYAGVQSTGTLFQYDNGAWADTGLVAEFQNWIPPVSPPQSPTNQGQVTLDLSHSANIAYQAATGAVYRVGPTGASYNIAGTSTVETISSAGDYFEFPALVSNAYQGYGLASAADMGGIGPNDNGVQAGILWDYPTFQQAQSGRSCMAYFSSSGYWTYGSQNGGGYTTGTGYNNQLLRDLGMFTGSGPGTGAQIRVGLDENYRFYCGIVDGGVVKVIYRSINPLPVQNYKFVWCGRDFSAVLNQLPNRVAAVSGTTYSDTHYVEFDGTNEDVALAGGASLGNVLDLSTDWSFGFKIASTWNPTGADSKDTVLRNGQNSFYIRGANTGNAAPYIQNGTTYQGQNTWNPAVAGDYVTITYDAATNRARYYRNGSLVGGGWNLTLGDASDGTMSLATGGGWGNYLAGGLDRVWFCDRRLTDAEASETAVSVNPDTWSFWDDVIDFLLMGEGTFPSIDGLKSVVSGVMQNGEPGDFVAY